MTADTPSDKQALRQAVLARRDGLDAAERARKSSDIVTRLLSYLAEKRLGGQCLSAYWPIRSEVDLRSGLEPLAEAGAVLALPAVLDKATIVFRRYQPGDPLEPGGFGTSAPPAHAELLDPDVLIMPLVGFDQTGARLGYGAGHYDRAIARLQAKGRAPKTIGVAFEMQSCTHIPTEPHDWPLDAVITEAAIYECSMRGATL